MDEEPDCKVDPTQVQCIIDEVEELLLISKFDEALEKLQKIINGFDEDTELLTQARLKVALGNVYIFKRDWTKTKKYLREAEGIIVPHLNKNDAWKKAGQELFTKYGEMYWRTGTYDMAEVYLDKAAVISQVMDKARGNLYISLGNVKGEMGELATAIDSYHKALHILLDHKAEGEVMRAYNNLADAYIKKKEYDWAVYFALKGVEAASGKSDRSFALACMTAAEALIFLGKIDLASSHIGLAERAMKDVEDDYVKGALLQLKGRIEMKEGKLDDARATLATAAGLMAKAKIPYYHAKVFQDFGELHILREEPDKAREYYEKALEIFEEHQCRKEMMDIRKCIEKLV